MPHQIGPQNTHWGSSFPSAVMQLVYSAAPADWASEYSLGEFVPLCSDAVGPFWFPSLLGLRTLTGGVLTPLQRCSWSILMPQPTVPQNIHWGSSYPSSVMQLVYSYAPSDWASEHSLRELFPLCSDAVGLFCSPSRLGLRILIGGVLTPLQRCSWSILIPQPTGPQNTHWGSSYPSAEMQLIYSNAPADWACFNYCITYNKSSILLLVVVYWSWIFHTRVCLWASTGVWVTASLLWSPWLCSVF